jgi:fibro-slime domain-containing protein
MRAPGLGISVALVSLGTLVLGCGGRSELRIFGECLDGDARECAGACGTGTQECRDGAWQECVIPDTAPCENACGAGFSSCTDGVWSICRVPEVTRDCSSVCGPGTETCRDGVWQPCNAPPPKPPELKVTIRDFLDTHPDFENGNAKVHDTGIVFPELGPDEKPVYAYPPCSAKGCFDHTVTTSGQAAFDQWYRDVPGTNLSMTFNLALVAQDNAGGPRLFAYENHAFFPIDGLLFGNQGRPHNYHFTLEGHTSFTYVGGERFTFSGDDDMWVFVNRRLAIDLGGVHETLTESINLDDIADEFGLERGGTYPIHFFFAERQTFESNFSIHTTIAEASSCD